MIRKQAALYDQTQRMSRTNRQLKGLNYKLTERYWM